MLTIGVGHMWGANVSIAASDLNGMGSSNYAEGEKTVGDFTISATGCYGTTQFRITQNKTLTITCNTGTMTAITFTTSGTYTLTATNLTNQAWSDPNGQSSVSFTQTRNGAARITNIAITYSSSCSNKVTLTKGLTTNGTFDLDQKDGSYDNCDDNFVVHVSNIVPANNAQYCNGINVTGGNSSVSGPVDGVWTVTYTKENNITSTITPNFANKTAASISFENAGTPAPTTSGYYVGDTYKLPSTNNFSCSGGKTFVGWSTVDVAETNTKPASNFYEPGADVTLAASQTFHAVFATASSGSGSTTATISQTALKNGISGTQAYGDDASSINDNQNKTWHIKANSQTTGNYRYIQMRIYNNNSGVSYIQLPTFPGNISSITLTVSSNSGNNPTAGGNSTTLYLCSNADANVDNPLASASGTSSITLTPTSNVATGYIKAGGGIRIWDISATYSNVTYSKYSTTCCEPLGSINGSFNGTNVAVDGTDVTVSLFVDNLVEGATGYRFVLYDNAATPTEITHKDVNQTSDVSCTFGSSDGIKVGTTYKVSVITLGDGSTNCEVGGESSKISVVVPNMSVWTVSYDANTTDDVTGMPAAGTQILQTAGTGNLSDATPARTGYTFVGWSDASGANNTKNYNAGGEITITGDKTVYAVWSATNYSVTMAKSPAAAASDEAVVISANQSNKHYGDQITVSVTAHPGYVFTGWTASPSVTFADATAESTTFSMPASDVTVTANFKKILTVAEARYIIDNGSAEDKAGVYVKGIVSGIVEAYQSQYGNISYNLSDDGLTTSNQLEAFRGKSYSGANFSSADDIQVGDEVVVYGDITYYANSSLYEFKANNQLYSLKRLNSISVKTAPDDIEYTANEHFNPAGLVITLTYSNSDTEDVAYAGHESDFTFSPTTSANLTAANSAVTITYKGKSVNQAITVTRIATELGWSAASYEATQGDSYTFPTLSTITPAAIASSVTYSSTNTDVATINASGVITVKTFGETTIKADFAQTNIYAAAATASYTLTILEDMTPRLVVEPNSLTFTGTPKDDSANETFNLVGTHLGANATLAITSATEGDAAMFSVTGSVAKDGSGAIDEDVTVTYHPTTAGSHSATLTISSTGAADVTVALSGTALETDIYKSALHTSASAWTSYEEGVKKAGNGYSIPNPGSVAKGSDNCEGNHYHFAGWVTEANKDNVSGNIIAATGTKNATGSIYWAVWEKETATGPDTYEMTTSVAVGDVVVIAEIDHAAENKAGKELSGFTTTGTLYGLGSDFETIPAGTTEWTVVEGNEETGVAFKSNNKYLYWSSGNSLNTTDELTANSSWTVSTESSRAKIVNKSDNTRAIMWNSSSPRFAAYSGKAHEDAVQGGNGYYYYPVFYKKVPGVVYGDPIAYCCTPHDIILADTDGEVYNSTILTGVYRTDPTSACAGTEVELTALAEEGYEFGEWTVTYVDGESQQQSVTVENNKFSMPDFETTVSATFTKIAVTAVTINGYSSVAKGANITLTLEITPSTARPTVEWSSSNNDIATVVDGVVTGVAQGSVTITATVDGTDYTKDITVTRETKLNSITVVSPKTAYTLNEEFVAPRVDANYLYVDNESEAPTLENVEGATFDGFDNQHAGEQTITVTYGGKTTTYDVTVSAWTLNLQTKSQTGPATVTPATTQVTIDTYGSEIDLTDYYVANLCSDYTQVGFIASSTDVDSDSEPENLLTAYTPTADNQTLYAVFSHTGYTGEVLVNENFSSITSASSNNTEISDDDFDWMYAKSKAYPEEGYVKLGSSNYPGSITTIKLDLRHKFKVSLDAKKYGTDGGNITITADETDWTNGDALTDAFASIEYEFNAVGKDKQITIETTSKRAYIDNIKIETLDEIAYSSVYDCRSDMTVTYAIATADAEAGATGACEQETVKQGNDYTVCTNEPTWAGHEFAGWSDGSNIVGAIIENVQNAITLTATWTEIVATSISISSDAITAGTMTLDDGRTATLTVTFDPTDTYNKTLTWSEDSHYTITDNGDGTYQIQAKDVTAGITVTATTANSKSASFSLVINQATKLTGLTLEGLTEANTVYTIGDAFSTTGIVVNTTVNMGDAPEDVEADFSTPDMTSAGVKTVTVEYTHPEYGYASTTYEITVNAKYVHLYKNETLIETRTLNSTAESVTLPDGDNATWAPKVAGYSLIGFADAANAQYPKVAAGASYVPSVQEISLYALYTNVAPTYTLISSAGDLVIGRSIIIATKDAASDSKHYAIGELNFTQAGVNNNRKGTEVTKSGDGKTLTAYAGATEFILMAGKNTDTYALYDPINGKYVCATTTSSNYLRLEETLSAEGSWTITPNSVISATTGNNKHLRFNYNGGNPTLFSCYAENKQAAIAVYQSNVEVEYDPTMEMEVTTAQTLNTADVDESVNVIVKNGGELTVGSELEINNIIVENGGKLNVSDNLNVNNIFIKAEAGASGQVTGAEQVEADGLFMDITLFTSAEGLIDADYWYSVAVPFDVDINSGIYKLVGTTATQLHNSADFDVWYYDTEYRASSQRTGWKRLNGKMQAGHAYLIGFDDGMSNKVRFKAADGWKTNLFNDDELPLTLASDGGDGTHSNWNGIANPTMHYIGTTADVQVFDNDNHTYSQFSNYNYVVGTAFFVKATSESFAIGDVDANNEFRAPKRESENKYEFSVRICKGEAERFDNQMYVRASEEASAEFDANRDITSMNSATAPSAMLWTENYGGKRLAIEDAPIVNNTASYVLGLYAPKAGQYRIEATDSYDNADLYLTYEGSIIWNLSMGAYEIELAKGATNGYGLLLQAKAPGVATGVDNVQGDNVQCTKVVIDDHVYILRGGQMYDVTGKMVK